MEKVKLDPYISPYTKISSRWIIDLNVNGKNIKLLGDNVGEHLYDFKVRKYFLNGTQKILVIKENSHIKIKNFCLSKDTIEI